MADQGTWQDVKIPWAHVAARLLGRGCVLMDPGSAFALRAMLRALKRAGNVDLALMPKYLLQELLAEILRFCCRIGDELDRRDGL